MEGFLVLIFIMVVIVSCSILSFEASGDTEVSLQEDDLPKIGNHVRLLVNMLNGERDVVSWALSELENYSVKDIMCLYASRSKGLSIGGQSELYWEVFQIYHYETYLLNPSEGASFGSGFTTPEKEVLSQGILDLQSIQGSFRKRFRDLHARAELCHKLGVEF